MNEIKSQLLELKDLIKVALDKIDLSSKIKELEALKEKINSPDFWNDPKQAGEVSQKASSLEKVIAEWREISADCNDFLEMLPEVIGNEDEGEEGEEIKEFKGSVEKLLARWKKLEISTFLSGKYDNYGAIVTISAGAGGTDAADFAEMLLRMYLRYAERVGFSVSIIDKSAGEEAGIKSCSFSVNGAYAYGFLKGEAGVHRLVRLSPFNAKNTRETSFALVEVLPEITNDLEIQIAPDDLKIDTFRASSAGGQSVNTTDSAVRITHIPTGVIAACQNERSQLQNKEQAMRLLKSKLMDLMEKQQAKELKELRGERVENSFGSQIRSYVLHPYKMVKDHRSGYEESNPERVLDGEIESFIEAELKR